MNNKIRELYEEKNKIEYKIEGIQRALEMTHNKQKRHDFFDILVELREEAIKLRNKIEFMNRLRMELDNENMLYKTK